MGAILIALALAGEVTEASVQEYATVSAAERVRRIESLTAEIERLKRRKRRDVLAQYRAIRWTFPDQKPTATEYVKQEEKERASKIATLQRLLSDLKDYSMPYFSTQFPRRMGQLGKLSSGVEVVQIISARKCLIDSHQRIYMLSGVSTNDWRDGQLVEPEGVFHVSGNETYETTNGGSKTVYVIESVDLSEHEERFVGRP